MATDTDYSETPYARQAREVKAMELEELAIAAGKSAADLADEAVRASLLASLSEQRGKRTDASLKTWRLVWRFLRDRETHSRVPASLRESA